MIVFSIEFFLCLNVVYHLLSFYSRYEFAVMANTSAGAGYSPWTIASTGESLPTGLPVLQANRDPDNTGNGQSLLIYWEPPTSPNGVITTYVLYDDLYVVYQVIFTYILLSTWP